MTDMRDKSLNTRAWLKVNHDELVALEFDLACLRWMTSDDKQYYEMSQ